MGREFELKYAARPEQQAQIAAQFGDFQTVTMATTYYDTPDGALAARHITLRSRLENGVCVCTVKTPQAGNGRGEWELEWEDIQSAIPALCKLGCREDLIAITAGGIMPVCGARFTRLAKTLALENCVVELALDSGVLTGGSREEPLCEVEIELKSGSEAAAVAFAGQIASQYGLTPEKKSKFRRALALVKGE